MEPQTIKEFTNPPRIALYNNPMQEDLAYINHEERRIYAYLRWVIMMVFLLCFNGLCAKSQWYKYFHLGELPEFSRPALEVLRQPLEDRKITISRAKYSVEYPCSFMFVASMNPCPCGYYGDPTHHCVCSPGQIQRYLSRISGPMMDRFDLHIEVASVSFQQLSQMKPGEPSANIRARVIKARQIQEKRYSAYKGIYCNAQMTERMLHEYAEPDASSLNMLRTAMERLSLSARAYSRILKVARTIADLDGSEQIQIQHIAEAIGYRNLDRGDWAERGG